MGNRRENFSFSVAISDEERSVVRHIRRCPTLFVHIAQHRGELDVFHRIVGRSHEHRTLVIHTEKRVQIGIFAKDFLALVRKREAHDAVSAIVVLDVDGLCAVHRQTRIFGRI